MPRSGSGPTWVISRPNTTIISPFTTDLPSRPAARQRLSTISEKYSGGPSFRASRLIVAADSARIMVEKHPPMKDPIAAMASAGPPRPALAKGWPSNVVTTVSDSPGTFISTLVIVPP